MAYLKDGFSPNTFWELVERQHGVIAHCQLRRLGMHPQAVKRRVASGRLHRLWPGVYAVGRPQVTRTGRWQAATLASGGTLAAESAAALAGLGDAERRLI